MLGLLITAVSGLGVVRSGLGVVGSRLGVVRRWLMVVGRLGAIGGRLGMIGGRLGMVSSRLRVVGSWLRVVGSWLGVVGLGSLVKEGLGVAMDMDGLSVFLGLAKGVGLAANAEAGVGTSVWQGGRQRHEGNEGEEGLESGKGDGAAVVLVKLIES